MNRLAESYVRLVLAVGQHDPDYVDAYYGPYTWEAMAKAEALSLEGIKHKATEVAAELKSIDASHPDEIVRLRHQHLARHLDSLIARVQMLGGLKLTFDEESRALYDAVAPTHSASHFQEILDQLSSILPGDGSVRQRYEEFRREFVVPPDKLKAVFTAAINEARTITKRYIELPENEKLAVEYVNNKPWPAYHWFKGNSCSIIQVNTDLPIHIDRVIDLAGHEGYPGHHVYNTLLEQHLVKRRNWVEFCVYPLFSPKSLLAEGTANYGVEMAFPRKERVAFEEEVLFHLAGLDSTRASEYYDVQEFIKRLNYAENEAARRYLNSEIGPEEATEWLIMYALMSKKEAQHRVRFFDRYRSYVINYNLGRDLVKTYIETRGGPGNNRERRWIEFERLISSPRLPSGLN
jgi:hypothetical protein